MATKPASKNTPDLEQLARDIKLWGRELGFQKIGITDTDLSAQAQPLKDWLAKGFAGSMGWIEDRLDMRLDPQQLVPGTVRVISARMDYLPGDTEQIKILKDADKAYVSRYALGRDYHKLIRKRLSSLAKKIEQALPDDYQTDFAQRAFVDSAPILERPLAEKAGLGWTGKHTLILDKEAGSWFFLGEIYTSVPLPVDDEVIENQCGDCTACLKVCPTDAFVEPYALDARRCISYLTIEHKGAIPEEFREVLGNRVYGCDDCQAICPWNKYASFSQEDDFKPRHNLDKSDLTSLFSWSEEEFLARTAGSPIRRIGYANWLRNLSVGLGNANSSLEIQQLLDSRLKQLEEFNDDDQDMLKEHLNWALTQQLTEKKRRKRKLKRNAALD